MPLTNGTRGYKRQFAAGHHSIVVGADGFFRGYPQNSRVAYGGGPQHFFSKYDVVEFDGPCVLVVDVKLSTANVSEKWCENVWQPAAHDERTTPEEM